MLPAFVARLHTAFFCHCPWPLVSGDSDQDTKQRATGTCRNIPAATRRAEPEGCNVGNHDLRKHVPRTADLNHWFWSSITSTTRRQPPSLRLLTGRGGEDTNCLSDVDCTKSRRRATSIHSQGSNELLMTNCCQHASVLWLHLRSMTPPITAATYSLSPDRSAHGPSNLGLRVRTGGCNSLAVRESAGA